MPDVKITCRPNGPLLIDGTVAITDSKGQPVPLDPGKTMVALCRCGHSGNKPLCDGSHKTANWSE